MQHTPTPSPAMLSEERVKRELIEQLERSGIPAAIESTRRAEEVFRRFHGCASQMARHIAGLPDHDALSKMCDRWAAEVSAQAQTIAALTAERDRARSNLNRSLDLTDRDLETAERWKSRAAELEAQVRGLSEAATFANYLIDVIEGPFGWATCHSQHGMRLKDAPEYVAAYLKIRAVRDDAALSPAPAEAPAQGETLAAPALWCVHVRGPDDVHPVADYDAAVKLADELNAIGAKANAGRAPDDAVLWIAYPAIWPWSPASHAAGLLTEGGEQ